MRFQVFTTILAVLAAATAVAGMCLWLRERGMRPLAQLATAWQDWAGGSRLRKAVSLVALAALVSWAGTKPDGEIVELSNNRIIESAEAAGEDFDAKNAKGNHAKFAKAVGSRVPRDRDGLEGLVGRGVSDAPQSVGRDDPIAPQDEMGTAGEAALSLNGLKGREGRQGLEAEESLGDLASGLVLVRVGTNEVFDFSAPDGATVAEKWRRRGASKDYLRLNFSNWSFPFGRESFSNFVVFAGGRVRLSHEAALCPFATNLGIVPEANWSLWDRINRIDRIDAGGDDVSHGATKARSEGEEDEFFNAKNAEVAKEVIASDLPISTAKKTPSLFWCFLTPSNTLVLTWQNALLDREASNPVSFQAELFRNGNVVFRYDLSRISDEGLLTNAVVSVGRLEGQERREGLEAGEGLETGEMSLSRSLTSLFFKTASEFRCDETRTAFDDALGGLDPLACPPGSTNTVWEHYVYTGTTNGAFALPSSTASAAVLRVAVSGSGRGELLVGDRAVPLVGEGSTKNVKVAKGLVGRDDPIAPQSVGSRVSRDRDNSVGRGVPDAPQSEVSRQILLSVHRSQTTPLYLRADATLSVFFSSDDFAFGVLPDPAASRLSGRINFPNVTATTPCFHDYVARQKVVTLPAGADADANKFGLWRS